MNILTKNRIIEKGDEFRHTDGRWLPVPDKNVGLQIMFSEYKEVRRPNEEPPKPLSPERATNPAKAEKEKTPVPTPSGTGATFKARIEAAAAGQPAPIENSHLPTVISRKAHESPQFGIKDGRPTLKLGLPKTTPVQIEYSDLSSLPNWIGRNGTFKATGLNVERTKNGLIQLRPIGRRGLAKNALIEIPVADIPTLIGRLDALNTMKGT